MAIPLDRILLEELAVACRVGIHDWEQAIDQKLLISVEAAWDLAPAAASGELAQTLDYHAMGQAIEALLIGQSWRLIETVAERVSQLLLEQFGLTWVRIRVAKPGALPKARSVAVLIERARAA